MQRKKSKRKQIFMALIPCYKLDWMKMSWAKLGRKVLRTFQYECSGLLYFCKDLLITKEGKKPLYIRNKNRTQNTHKEREK